MTQVWEAYANIHSESHALGQTCSTRSNGIWTHRSRFESCALNQLRHPVRVQLHHPVRVQLHHRVRVQLHHPISVQLRHSVPSVYNYTTPSSPCTYLSWVYELLKSRASRTVELVRGNTWDMRQPLILISIPHTCTCHILTANDKICLNIDPSSNWCEVISTY